MKKLLLGNTYYTKEVFIINGNEVEDLDVGDDNISCISTVYCMCKLILLYNCNKIQEKLFTLIILNTRKNKMIQEKINNNSNKIQIISHRYDYIYMQQYPLLTPSLLYEFSTSVLKKIPRLKVLILDTSTS